MHDVCAMVRNKHITFILIQRHDANRIERKVLVDKFEHCNTFIGELCYERYGPREQFKHTRNGLFISRHSIKHQLLLFKVYAFKRLRQARAVALSVIVNCLKHRAQLNQVSKCWIERVLSEVFPQGLQRCKNPILGGFHIAGTLCEHIERERCHRKAPRVFCHSVFALLS